MQRGSLCWCGNSYDKYQNKPDSECSEHCGSDGINHCGAVLKNTIYKMLVEMSALEIADPGLITVYDEVYVTFSVEFGKGVTFQIDTDDDGSFIYDFKSQNNITHKYRTFKLTFKSFKV